MLGLDLGADVVKITGCEERVVAEFEEGLVCFGGFVVFDVPARGFSATHFVSRWSWRCRVKTTKDIGY